MNEENRNGEGMTFKIYPSNKKDGRLSLKLWAKNQFILLLAMVPIGGGILFFGGGGMLVFLLLIMTLPVSLFIAAKQFTPVLEKIGETLPRVIFHGDTLTLPLYDGKTVTIPKDKNLEVRASRYSSSTGVPNSNVSVYGVVVDLVMGDTTYRLWGQGRSKEAAKQGIEVQKLEKLPFEQVVRMPIDSILKIYSLMC